MTWGAIGGAAVSVVGGALVNKMSSKGGGSSNPVTAADPFASQRAQYQPMLQQLVTGNGMPSNNSQAEANMSSLANGNGVNNLALGGISKASSMLSPGYKFDPSDPLYQFMLDQGSENINRNAAAGGMLNSGNVLAALQDYGQNTALKAFQTEFGNNLNMASSAENLGSQMFNENTTVDQNAQNQYNNRYQQLAQLSGATVGSPAAAASQLTNQQAGVSSVLGKAGSALWNYATGGTGNDSTSTDTFTPTTDYAAQLMPTLYSGGGGYDMTGGLVY